MNLFDKLIIDFLIEAIIENRTLILTTLLLTAKELLEYWLGKTDKVEAGSTLELFILLGKKVKGLFESRE